MLGYFNTEKIFELLVRLIVLCTAIPIHECAHALVADKLGDPTARNLGRITLNPFAHFDLFGSLMMLLTGFGWAKPVPVTTRYFKNIKRDMAITAIAGPISNMIVAFVALFLLKGFWLLAMGGLLAFVSQNTVLALSRILLSMVTINIGLAVFNLLPVPPLDGSRLLTALLPPKLYFTVMRYERVIMMVLFLALFTGVLSTPLNLLSITLLNGMDMMTGFMGRIW